MGLGAYLATVSDTQHYDTERRREEKELQECPEEETEEIYRILGAYGPDRKDVAPYVVALKENPEQWIQVRPSVWAKAYLTGSCRQFMMDFELRLERPARNGAYLSSAAMGLAYFIGNNPGKTAAVASDPH
jgi:hypothetical protein